MAVASAGSLRPRLASEVAIVDCLTVAFLGGASRWRKELDQHAAPGWRCVEGPADIAVIGPFDDPTSQVGIVVVADHRRSSPTEEIVRAYRRGASLYVSQADTALLVAHLDALVRGLHRR